MSKSNSAAALVAALLLAGCVASDVAPAPDKGARGQAPSGAQLKAGNEPLELSLGTATPGGGFPVYGAALVETVSEADPAIIITAVNTKGSAENVPLLEQGKLDLALVQGEAAYEALAGINRAKPTDIKILWAMYSSPGMFVVRADSPYRTIDDLRGKPVAWGAKGS